MEILERIDDQHVRVRFKGAYGQPAVVWRAEIMTLKKYRSRHADFNAEHGDRTTLMAVDSIDTLDRRITIALPVSGITQREIAMSVVMVRNYRKMQPGLRQWCG